MVVVIVDNVVDFSEGLITRFLFINLNIQQFSFASGVGLIPLYCGHFWPIVPAPDDRRG